jgi:hypothetical protein
VERILQTVARVSFENEKYFCDLDGEMGDADFGKSIGDGFRAVIKELPSIDRTDIGVFSIKVGTVFASHAGGTSGPIWGTAGEKGRRRDKLPSADAVVDELFDAVSKDLPFDKGDNVGLMINGLGGTPPSELYLLYRRAALRCQDAGLKVARNYVGEYCTSLEMAGFSLTLIRLDDELTRLLDAPAEIAWRVF